MHDRRAGAVLKRGESRRVAQRYVALIDSVAGRIEPDDRSLEAWFSNYVREHRQRLARDLELIEHRLAAGDRVLECGAVPPILTGALAELGLEIDAVDVRPERFSSAISALGLAVARCDIETEVLPFDDEGFDAVLFNELFEHLRINPIFTFGEVHRVLRLGGRLVLSTPNLRSFRGLRNLLLGHQAHAVSGGLYRQYDKLETLGHMGHVREYTAREVCDFLRNFGFEIREIIFRGGHGRGIVGLAERVAPSMRPFFSVVATKEH